MIFAGLKVVLQVVLIAMFFYMYGLPAWEKLNKQSTIVIKTKEDTNGIQAPSITISARSTVTKSGWKRTAKNTKPDEILLQQCKNFSSVEECLNSETFPRQSFIADAIRGFNGEVSLMNTRSIWVPDFTYVYSGRSYTFQPKLRIGPDFWRDQIFILLRKGFRYEIFVHEQNLFVTNGNSDTLPFKFIRIFPDDAKDFKFFYTISVIQHIEKNVPADPCVENDQYSFTTCVKESLARKVGCRPSWDVYTYKYIIPNSLN